jgi:GntR family transcriptional regulator, sialic acid-inducible nan operon repressor
MAAGLGPAARRRRGHEVAEAIEAMIASGEYRVGDTLPSEKDLAERLSVGRPAVREALFMLEQQGRVEVMNGARARVAQPNAALIVEQLKQISRHLVLQQRGHDDIVQVRMVLESGLAWLAARTATDADIARLRAALDANIRALGNAAEFIRTDVAFHFEIALMSRNPIFATVQEVLVEWLIDQRTSTLHMPDADTLSIRDHTAIFEAIAAREPARAFHEMAGHLELVARLYREAQRLSESILRGVTQDVARRFAAEKEQIWASGLGRSDPGLKPAPDALPKQESD